MTLEIPTAPHVRWPAETTWCQAWSAIGWDSACKRWRCSLNGMFVSGAYARWAYHQAAAEVGQALARRQAARVEWLALAWADSDGAVRYGMNFYEARVAHNIELLTKELR